MTEKLRQARCLNGLSLKCLAMAAMLIDHIGAVLLPELVWLRCVGRLAFPIFAFLVAEGFAHTRNFKKYLTRMALFALMAEIPFDLCYGTIWDIAHQNVLWTFCLALLCLRGIGWVTANRPERVNMAIAASLILSVIVGNALRVDYGGYGVALVLLFWLIRQEESRELWQFFAMLCINCIILGGIQCLAMFALVPIWLYNEQPGPRNRVIQYACYAFYPVHMLVLGVLAMYLP